MANSELKDASSISVEFCRRQAGYGCETKGGIILADILDADQCASLEAGGKITTEIAGIRATISCSGCLGMCCGHAVAGVRVGIHSDCIIFPSTEKFTSELLAVVGRTEEEWAELEKPKMTEEEFEAWIRERQEETARHLAERRREYVEQQAKKNSPPNDSSFM